MQAEQLHQHSLDLREAHVLGHMLIHRPTFQTVEMLVQSLVWIREEGCVALLAAIGNGLALDHPSPHRRRSEDQVERSLPPRIFDLMAAARDLNDGLRPTVR